MAIEKIPIGVVLF